VSVIACLRQLPRYDVFAAGGVEWLALQESRFSALLPSVHLRSGIAAVAQSENHQSPSDTDREHYDWVSSALRAMEKIKVGMIRSDLMTVFTDEGGLSTTSQRTYVYRQCPFIKVDVEFAASSRTEELSTDKITKISRPYLAWSIAD
jgi:hypothetical protein